MTGQRDVAHEVLATGCCLHPVRLVGRTLDAATGELAQRSVLVACKDRRWVVCPACAERYKGDAYFLVAAGLRGGKGVPASVGSHPAVFVTLTAPSFGPVHSRPHGDRGGPCRPRRTAVRCPHGVSLTCSLRHGTSDPALGRPLCVACFDYAGAVAWNAAMTRLWQRTTTMLVRALARAGEVSVREQPGVFRCSYVKVAEFQRRGLVHVHAIVRADGPEGPGDRPPPWLDGALLVRAIEEVAARAGVEGHAAGTDARSLAVRWGTERTVRELCGDDHDAVAAYLAKYAVKAATTVPGSLPDLHTASLVAAARRTGATGRRAHAQTFGYGGHFLTKSILWSTTFAALRGARADYRRAAVDGPLLATDEPWRYAGRGYRTDGAEALAGLLADAITTRPHRVPTMSPDVPADIPPGGDQGR